VRIRGYADGTPCLARLRTADPDKAARFYGDLFGWHRDGDVFRLGTAVVAGLVPEPDPVPAWLTYLATDDLDGLSGRVADAGGAVVYPPAPVGGRGRTALFRDPVGAEFGAWQRGTCAGAQIGGEAHTVCWSELVTADEPGATLFYGKVFGWSTQPGELAPDREYREWLLHERVVAGLIPLARPATAPTVAYWRTTVEVLDLADTVQRCLDLAGQVALAPLELLVGRYTRLVDAQGAGFGVIELIPELRGLPT